MLQSVADDANVNAAGELKEYFGLATGVADKEITELSGSSNKEDKSGS